MESKAGLTMTKLAGNGKRTASFQVAWNANHTMTPTRRETQMKKGQIEGEEEVRRI